MSRADWLVALVLALAVIGILIVMDRDRLPIHGTAIVTRCELADGPLQGRRSNCVGRFDPDGPAPVIEHVTFASKRKYVAGEMLGAGVTDLGADEAVLDGYSPPYRPLSKREYPVAAAAFLIVALILVDYLRKYYGRDGWRLRRKDDEA
jgi:hypothetical protein